MAETANIGLPLVQAAQAQKHVTVNEAFALLDAVAQLRLVSITQTIPPGVGVDGVAYYVPPGASDAWVGHVGEVAVASNGGWVFVAPRAGWRAWIEDTQAAALFDGVEWASQAVAISPNGAASVQDVVEIDVDLTPGSRVTSVDIIPAGCVVYGITGIVTDGLTGSLSGWKLGVPTGEGRYGTGLGTTLGSWVTGLTGQPQAYYAATPLELVAEGGDFIAGRVRLAVHLYRMTIPRV